MSRAGRGWAPSPRATLLLAVVAPAVPLVVALLSRWHPPWVPDLDLALTELRVRDVGGSHSPLVGLPGRIGTLDRQGSHPGPISFYLLAPVYRLLGSTSFALQASTVLLHLAGACTAVVLVARRAGPRWALVTGGGLAVLVAGLGPDLFTEPWNPHVPILWWPAFLVAVWCALTGDAAVLPVVVLAGAVCAQTHVSYLGAVGLLTIVAVAVAVGWPDRAAARRPGRWALAAVALGLVLWAPPVVDQLRHDPGNAGLLADHLLHPPEPTVGLADGMRLTLERLDLVQLTRAVVIDPGRLADGYPAGASAVRGGLLGASWALIAASTLRRAPRTLRALHALGGVGAVLGVVSVGRIVGYPWSYLMVWVWSVALLLVVAIAAALPVRRAGAVMSCLFVLVAAIATRATVAASSAAADNPVLSRSVTAMAPVVAEALEPGERYLVTWTDAVNLGGHGYGMYDELERRGVDVAVRAGLGTQFGEHRTVTARPADRQIVVATGAAIGRWSRAVGVREVVRVDARTVAERRESAQVRAALVVELRRAGLADLVPVVDENLYGVAFDRRLTPAGRTLVDRLGALGAPAAVFLAPVGTELP